MYHEIQVSESNLDQFTRSKIIKKFFFSYFLKIHITLNNIFKNDAKM